MRVCDVNKTAEATKRVIVIEVDLNYDAPNASGEVKYGESVLLDLDLSSAAFMALKGRNWSKLTELTPRADRVKSSARSEGARKAAATKAANKAAVNERSRPALPIDDKPVDLEAPIDDTPTDTAVDDTAGYVDEAPRGARFGVDHPLRADA